MNINSVNNRVIGYVRHRIVITSLATSQSGRNYRVSKLKQRNFEPQSGGYAFAPGRRAHRAVLRVLLGRFVAGFAEVGNGRTMRQTGGRCAVPSAGRESRNMGGLDFVWRQGWARARKLSRPARRRSNKPCFERNHHSNSSSLTESVILFRCSNPETLMRRLPHPPPQYRDFGRK